MKTVSHPAGLGRALPGCLSIQTAAVSAHDLDRRTLLQPRFCALDAPILQNIDTNGTTITNFDILPPSSLDAVSHIFEKIGESADAIDYRL